MDAELWFYHGPMGSKKTAIAVMQWFNYDERGMKPVLLKPKLENRDGEKIIRSRIGIEGKCEYVEDFLDSVKKNGKPPYDVIIVDESQFLSREQVDALSDIVDKYDIPVRCYGLRTDFQSNAFEGSARLLEIADKLEEESTVCWCGHEARFNARVCNGHIVRDGAQIQLGGNESYVPLCRRHYKEGKLSRD